MIYLDNAATTYPKPQRVGRAMTRAMEEYGANPGRAGHDLAIHAARDVYQAREELSRLFRWNEPLDFVFGFNCTDMLNLAIKGAIKQGDHVATTFWEHNSVLRPLKKLEAEGRITLTIGDRLEDALTGNTNVAVLTHASNVTGEVQPLSRLVPMLKRRGITVIIDAAQTAGVLDIDLAALPIDLVAMPGHKGLLGPQGTGALFIRPGMVLDTLREGGTGSSSDSMIQPSEMPERYESGTLNAPGLAGLREGTRFAREHAGEIHGHELLLTERMLDGLLNIPSVTILGPLAAAARVGTVSFNLGDVHSGAVADQLNDSGICVRAGLHCAPGAHQVLGTLEQGAVRASVGLYNTDGDVDALLTVVQRVARQL
jgi:cysteine desulfurase family protein